MPGISLESDRSGTRRTYTHVFVGRSDNPKAEPLEIKLDPKLPQEGTQDPWDPLCYIIKAHAKRRGKSLELWDISLTSTTETETQEFVNPLNAPALWSAQTKTYEVPVTHDINKNPITNTAGDFFPDAKKRITGWQFTAELSVPDVDLDWIDDFTDCTNDNAVVVRRKLCPRGTLAFTSGTIGKPQRDNGVWHCPSSFTFEYSPLGWKFKPLNKGYRELVTHRRFDQGSRSIVEYKRIEEIVDAKGQPISEPAFLNREGRRPRTRTEAGNALTEVVKVPIEPSDIITLEYDVLPFVDFNRTGIFR